MGDKSRGLYNKFIVRREDGSHKLGGKHEGCEYFVLDLTHDAHAKAALLAYADSCEADYPLLAKDLRAKYPSPGREIVAWRYRVESGDPWVLTELHPDGDLFQSQPLAVTAFPKTTTQDTTGKGR